MSEFEYWRLCEQLTLVQAALLIVDVDPSEIEHEVERLPGSKQPRGYAASRQALIGALKSKRLEGSIYYDEGHDNNGEQYSNFEPHHSYVMTAGIPDWLREKGMQGGFFLPESNNSIEFLDPTHERYAPKLAAAIGAWNAAGTDLSLTGTPKQKVEKWMRLHASEYGLTQPNGKPNESAIQSIARIANWKPEGGAPATPSRSTKAKKVDSANRGEVVRLKTVKAQLEHENPDLDDEIPF